MRLVRSDRINSDSIQLRLRLIPLAARNKCILSLFTIARAATAPRASSRCRTGAGGRRAAGS